MSKDKSKFSKELLSDIINEIDFQNKEKVPPYKPKFLPEGKSRLISTCPKCGSEAAIDIDKGIVQRVVYNCESCNSKLTEYIIRVCKN